MLINPNYLILVPPLILWSCSNLLMDNWRQLENLPVWGDNPYLILITFTFYLVSISTVFLQNWEEQSSNQWFCLLLYFTFISFIGLLYSFKFDNFKEEGIYYSLFLVFSSIILLIFFTDWNVRKKYFNCLSSLICIIYLTFWINNLD